MKKLVLGTMMAAVVAQAAGCVVTPVVTPIEEVATITAHWSIESTAGTPASCPPGYTTAALYSQPVDASNRLVGQPIVDLFDCEDGSGFTDPLAPDVYASWIAITTANNSSTYAESIKAIVDVVDVDKDYTTRILTDGGYFEMTWDLVGANSNAPLSCNQVEGIDDPANGGVELTATVSGGNAAKTDQFNCDDHYGLSASFLEGSYTISVDAFQDGDPRGAGSLGTAPALTNKIIGNANKITDLGNIMIPIDGL